MVILDQDSAQKKTHILSQNSDFRQFNPAARWNAGIVSFSYEDPIGNLKLTCKPTKNR